MEHGQQLLKYEVGHRASKLDELNKHEQLNNHRMTLTFSNTSYNNITNSKFVDLILESTDDYKIFDTW